MIDSLEIELEVLVETDIKKLIENRWVFMQDSLFYDNEISSCWPCFNTFKFPTDDEFCSEKIHNIFPKYGKWEIPSVSEIKKTIKGTTIGNRESYGRLANKYGTIRYVFRNKNQFICLDNDSEWGTFNTRGHILPIWRLNGENGVKSSAEEALNFWLNNGLIPENLKFNEIYRTLIEICKKFKLSNLKFNRVELIEAHKNNELDLNFSLDTEKLEQKLLNCDKKRADILEYPPRLLEDINEGHWDLWDNDPKNLKNPVKMNLENSLVAKDPQESIIDGVVGIDFGTKSTIVVQQKDSNYTLPLRVGTGDLSKSIKNNHYENPTIMEFIDINNFMSSYTAREGRPETEIEDIVTSHNAFSNMIESPNANEFNSFFSGLKKWAGTKELQYNITDKQGTILELRSFLESNNKFDPIEIYAYYLGMHINNMHNGIYLEYYLSFPVTYEVEVRNKIRESFYKGIKKSLPQALLKNELRIKDFTVNEGTSEPAAYAITALKEYGFCPEENTKHFYG
ncbi:MAG: hypothetical protein ACRC6B_07200, partial [Fusobacteriaceae bacterium]